MKRVWKHLRALFVHQWEWTGSAVTQNDTQFFKLEQCAVCKKCRWVPSSREAVAGIGERDIQGMKTRDADYNAAIVYAKEHQI